MNKKRLVIYGVFLCAVLLMFKIVFKSKDLGVKKTADVDGGEARQLDDQRSADVRADAANRFEPLGETKKVTSGKIIAANDIVPERTNTNTNIRADQIPATFNTSNLVATLVQSLKSKLAMADSQPPVQNIENKCQAMRIEYNDTCNEADRICPQKVLPEDLQTRIEQLVLRDNLQIPIQYREVIKNMSQEVKDYHDLIVVSGLSSNHFLEAQALFKQLHEEVFPALKNFTFVVYSLGLTEAEASQVRKHCRCQFFNFPFESFPPHVKTLKCFGFKPAVVRAMIEKAEVVLWTDTSFRTSRNITEAIDRARKFGLQQRGGGNPSPSHTLEQTFHYFGDSPCAHMAFTQVAGGFGIYHNELLVKKAVLDPWLACGLRSECTCPVDQRKVQGCPSAHKTKKIGLCQRNDQSSMTVILAKLFREKFRSFAVSMWNYDKKRVGRVHQYFQELENATALTGSTP